MMVMHNNKFTLGLLLTLVGATTLSGIALLNDKNTHADTETASRTSTATVRVSTACSMTGEVTVAHTDSVQNGTYTTGIGTTKLTTICNDTNGYAIYVIGFSNDTYGNTNMIGAGTNLNIATGTATGDVSNWSMMVSKDTNSYNPGNLTIENGFNSYSSVPSTYTKVASYSAATDTTTGSTIDTTYAVRISSTQAADTYTGKVKYTMVHPANAATPNTQE